MHRIVYLEGESIIADVRRPDFPHHWVEHATTLQPQVAERLAGATIAIVNKLPIDAGLIAALPALQMVAVAATGTNNVDLDACRRSRHRRLEHPRLCRAYRSRACLRAVAGVVAQCRCLSAGGGCRQLAAFRAVLLYRLSDPRPARCQHWR
jgi:hypothetical protein